VWKREDQVRREGKRRRELIIEGEMEEVGVEEGGSSTTGGEKEKGANDRKVG
jgi:hypothetical protein